MFAKETSRQRGVFDSISRHNVTHISGAQTIMNMIINVPKSDQPQKLPLANKVVFMTGGASPPPQLVVFKMKSWDSM